MIHLKGVEKRYAAGVVAVAGLDLRIERGQLAVLLGESGCGKTTTLKMINRLSDPTAGVVEVDGRDVSGVDPVQLRRGIGYVFQGIGLFPHRTVGDNIAVVPRLLGWTEDRIRARIDELLELVGLPGVAGRFPSELSGGQQQRIGVARALAGEPAIVLMDEPFGALDPVTRDQLQVDFRALHDRLGLTTVMVTHDIVEALRLADLICVMQGGRIVRSGAPAELMADPGHPYVETLLSTPRRQAELLAALL